MSEIDKPRVLLVVPVFQSVYPQPFGNFTAMCLHAGSREHEHYAIDAYVPAREILHTAMNKAAGLVLAHGFEAMIVCDDDCLPPMDAISRLLRHLEAGRDIVAGVGFMRGYPHTTTAGRYYPEGISLRTNDQGIVEAAGFEWIERMDHEPDDLVPVDFSGFPIGLISARALRTIPAPWFGTVLDGGACTHDVHFGTKAKRAGLQPYVDRTLPCGHLCDGYVIDHTNRDIARRMMSVVKSGQLPEPQ